LQINFLSFTIFLSGVKSKEKEAWMNRVFFLFLLLFCAGLELAQAKEVTAREQLGRVTRTPENFSVNTQRGVVEFSGGCDSSRNQFRVRVDAEGTVSSVAKVKATVGFGFAESQRSVDFRPFLRRFHFDPLLVGGKKTKATTVFTVVTVTFLVDF
jgi:hypothetical protein